MAGIRFNQDYADPADPWSTGQMNWTTPAPAPQPQPTFGVSNPEPPQPKPTVPTTSAPSGDARTSAISDFYRQALGREPDQGGLQGWVNGGLSLAQVQQAIYGSPEAIAYSKSRSNPTTTTGGGSGDPNQWILDALRNAQSTDDPNYWISKYASGELGQDRNYIIDRINRGDGALAVRNGTLAKYGGGGGNVGQFGYDDPSSLLYLSSVMNRLQELQQPRHDPVQDQLAAYIQQLVAKSQQAPYTAGDDAALIARYREPLTQARDAELRRNREQASRKGYLPSSGLLRRLDTDTSNAYIRGMAQSSNDLGVRAVDEQNARALQAVQALSGLVQTNRQEQDRQDAVANERVRLSALFPEFDERRLNTLLGASGETPGAAISGLTGLGNLGLNATALNNRNSADSGAALADFLYRLMRGGN